MPTHRVCLLLAALCCFTSLPRAAANSGDASLAFDALPVEVRSRVLLGLPRHSKDIPGNPFGTQTVIMAEGQLGPVRVERLADAIAEAGYKWVAEYISAGWDTDAPVAESEPRWAELRPDIFEYAEALRARDISLIIRLDPVPFAPQPEGRLGSTLTRERTRVFTRHMVRQLKPYTRHWRVWNEPNLGWPRKYATPREYVELAALMASVIRAEQPDAVIYGPGVSKLQCLAEEPDPWVREVLAEGLFDHIDVFAYHPYRHPFTRDNIPELPSATDPGTVWPSYEAQIKDLRSMLEAHYPDRDIPLAVTEDGMPTHITETGEQPVSAIVQAKYELRRSLLDHWLGVRPRIMFTIMRGYPDPYYNSEHSFDALYPDYTPKPMYYAVQNLHAVLDDTYHRWPDAPVELTTNGDSQTPRRVHTYRKDHGDFEEMLVFLWAAVPSGDTHPRLPATLTVHDTGWTGPLLLDLMRMPGSAYGRGSERKASPPARQPLARPVPATLTGEQEPSVSVDLSDYPQVLKLVRLK